MDFVYLADRPDLIPTLASWAFHEWSHFFPNQADFENEYRGNLHCDCIPLTVVALDENEPIGTASIVINDGLPEYSHLSPWLASVYVVEERRAQGIGYQLVQRIIDHARRFGHHTLYLWTEDQAAWYARHGWKVIAEPEFRGQEITVMQMSLKS